MRRPLRAALATLVTGVALTVAAIPVAGVADADTSPAPLVGRASAARPDRYIVVLTGTAAGAGSPTRVDRQSAPALRRFRSQGVKVDRRYRHALNGFSARLDAGQLAELRDDPAVAYVARDGRFAAADVQKPVGTWGLDRIDQRQRPLDYSYGYRGTGAGVTAYIFDTGIRSTHKEFTGRLASGFNGIRDGRGTEDCNGHGTHVAGTVGGQLYGVAKQVTLVPVRVLNCNGYSEGDSIIAGIDWVTANHSGPSVVNMSLIGGGDQVTDDAISRSIAAGVTYVVAAGNDRTDACGFSPARLPAALTVGATSIDDSRASFSNHGSCLDLFAPGDEIPSAWSTGDNATYNDSGTSMASPHVAGAAALYLQANPGASPAQVGAALVSGATAGVVGDPGPGSPNRLLFQPAPANTGPIPPPPPAGLEAKQVSYGGNPTDDTLAPVLDVLNRTGQPIPLSAVTVRYWFTRDRGGSSVPTCDYTPRGCANLRTQVVSLYAPRPGADSYLDVGFTAGAGTLQQNQDTGLIQLRVQKQDYTAYDERNDWSYATGSTLAPAPRVTVYLNGRLAWGTEP